MERACTDDMHLMRARAPLGFVDRAATPAEKTLVVGDTLFRDSIGRTDLPGGDGSLILSSIREKFLPLPDDTVVIPGHGPTTTIGHERECNVFLQHLSGP